MDGKLGLAFSGGGLRAACFHVGVLARLAEAGWLPRVEVLSGVSGGAIVAALWYLDVRRLLETASDRVIAPEDYRRLVDGLDRAFRRGVTRDFRSATFADPLATLRMASPRYSRSDRLGDLFDRWLYRPVAGGTRPVALADLKIRPPDHEGDPFHPRRHNAGRRAKVPILKLNATHLATGHAWRFEASRMGEPVRGNGNSRYERPADWDDLPARLARFGLGRAVAASAAVPGLFPPVVLDGLYDGPVALSDGGVEDNLGLGGCLDEACEVIVVSDASAPLPDRRHPATGSIGVLGRAAEIMASRLREEQRRALSGRQRVTLVSVHLMQDIPPAVVRLTRGRPDPDWHVPDAPAVPGVDEHVQRSLAAMRTDLDAVTELESAALAVLGWHLAGRVIPSGGAAPHAWEFLRAQRVLTAPTDRERRQLAAGRHRLFRLVRVIPWLGPVVGLLALGLAALAGWWGGRRLAGALEEPVPLWSLLVWTGLVALVVGPPLVRALGRGGEPNRLVDIVRRVAAQLAIAALVTPLVWLQRWVVRPLVLRAGGLRD